MGLDTLNKEEKAKLSEEVNAELRHIAEVMRKNNMQLRRQMDQGKGFSGDEKIKDFKKQLKELGEESRTVTPKGNMNTAIFVGILLLFSSVFMMGGVGFVVGWLGAAILFIYAGIINKRNDEITSKKNQIDYIKTRIKELKEYGEE